MESGADTLAQLLGHTTGRIAAALGLPRSEARLEAQILIACALGVGRAWLVAHDRDGLSDSQLVAIKDLVDRRVGGEPIAYILGEREFYGRTFRVTSDTLIPRPETEHLVEAALLRLPADRPINILDIGTGSGCVAITLKLERPAWQVAAVDLSASALRVARENGDRLGADIEWLESDLFTALAGRRFHLIVSNPPYVAEGDAHLIRGDVRYEPATALASGPDGMETIRGIVEQAPTHLEPNGWLMFEHGWDQGEAVGSLLSQAGFRQVFLMHDLADQARISGARRDE